MIHVILVEPEYEMNIGYICRVMANFDVKNLTIVNPKCNIGDIAVKYSKHGVNILKKIKIVKDVKKAIKPGVIVGTTAIEKRYKKTIRSVIGLKDFLRKNKFKNINILVGRESMGLNKKEIELCDILIKIETSNKYPTLNISHALAIILYELKNKKVRINDERADEKEKKAFLNFFKKCINYKKGLLAMKRILYRANPTKKEIKMLLRAIKKHLNNNVENNKGEV